MAVYHVTANQTLRTQVIQNIHHYTTSNPLEPAQIQELVDGMRAAYEELVDVPAMTDNWSLVNAFVRRVDQPDLPSAVYTFTEGTLTGSIGNADPGVNQWAALVSFYAPTTQPRRGRTYLGGVHGDGIGDNGFINSTVLAGMALWGEAIMSITLTGDTAQKCAVRYTGDPPQVTTFNVFTEFVPRSNPAVQRRRRIGTGV